MQMQWKVAIASAAMAGFSSLLLFYLFQKEQQQETQRRLK